MKTLGLKKNLKSLLVTGLTIASLLIPAAGVSSAERPDGRAFSFKGGKRGQEAVDSLRDRLPEIAARYRKGRDKLQRAFLHDRDLWLDNSEQLLYLCSFEIPEGAPLEEASAPAIPIVPQPLDQTFLLHSLPGASKVIYLDFDGHTTSGTIWNTSINGGADIVSLPYDFNGNTGSFNDAELSRIQAIWARVAEDFAIYEIDVTTEDPGTAALRKSNVADQQYGVRVVISPTSSFYPNAGGVAYIGSFDWSTDTPAFVFSNKLANGNEKYVAEASSHETGHTLGLLHDGTTSGSAYYQGHGDWAPIMGNSYYNPTTQWSRGEYAGANNTEDDLAVMLTNGASYRPDDHGDWLDSPTVLSGENLIASGIIERTDDMDVFSFQIEAGEVIINAEPADSSPNLDILIQVLDSGGNIIAEGDPYYILPASISVNLPADTYYILVDGVGTGNPDTGYTDYASLGQYFISGTLPSADILPAAPTDLSASPASPSQINLSWSDNSSNENGFSIERSANGLGGWAEAGFSAADTATFTDTGLAANTSYHYRVTAYNVVGSSDYSNTAAAATFDLPPSAPANLNATPVSATRIDLDWTDNSDNENGFSIERSPDGVAGWAETATVADNITIYSDIELTPGSSYFYRVTAYNENGNSAYSNVTDAATDQVPPAGPTNLVAAPFSASQINLDWTDNGDNEDGFKIERSADGLNGWTEIGTPGANVTAYTDSGLNPATAYFYRVYAYNNAGNSDFSNTADTTTDQVPPAAPTSLVAAPLSAFQINLAWTDNGDNEDGFRIERSADGLNGWTEIGTPGANVTAYTDSGLNPDTAYFYRVYAYNSAGNSDFSNTADTTTDQVPPVAPTNLVAAPLSASQINLDWTDNGDNEDGFRIERSADGLSGWTEIGAPGANVTAYTDSGLNPDTAYFYRVYAYNSAANSDFSNTADTTTDQVPPVAPTNLVAAPLSASQINLDWTDNGDNEDGFRIERSADGLSGWTEIGAPGANVTAYTDSGLNPATDYFYRVYAYNSAGNSAYSNVANAATDELPPVGPSGLSATAVSPEQINLSWLDNADNETGFRVERSTDGLNGWTEIGAPGANVTAYRDSGLNPATAYFYRVYAYNSAGNSDFSNTADTTTEEIPPAGPTSLVAAPLSASQINLAWTDNGDNEDGFKIERSADGLNGWTQIAAPGANVTAYTDSGLNPATAYFYRVYAYNSAGNSVFSNTADATTDGLPPNGPSGLSATGISTEQIDLSWLDNADNEDGYVVQRSPNGIDNWDDIAALNADTAGYSDLALSPDTSYFYRVYAYNSAGNSAFSSVVEGSTISHYYAAGLNLVPFALSGTGIVMASDLDAEIVAANPGNLVTQIFSWDGINQRYTASYVNLGGGFTMGDFELQLGTAYFVETDGPVSLALNGADYTGYSLYSGLNVLAVPPSRASAAGIVMASDLDAEIVSSTGLTVTQIFGWDSVNQRYTASYVNLGGGFTMGDFVLDEGTGYFIEVNGDGVYQP